MGFEHEQRRGDRKRTQPAAQNKVPQGNTEEPSGENQYEQIRKKQRMMGTTSSSSQNSIVDGVEESAVIISGHGDMIIDKDGTTEYTLPADVTVIQVVPDGATLGDMARVISKGEILERKDLLDEVKVNTTEDIWKNKYVAQALLDDKLFEPRPGRVTRSAETRQTALDAIKTALEKVTKGEKLSKDDEKVLEDFESSDEFETWLDGYAKESFYVTHPPGSRICDVKLTPFSPTEEDYKSLVIGAGGTSEKASSQNDYRLKEEATNLSNYIKKNKEQKKVFIVNSCTAGNDQPFTGIQFDRKE